MAVDGPVTETASEPGSSDSSPSSGASTSRIRRRADETDEVSLNFILFRPPGHVLHG